MARFEKERDPGEIQEKLAFNTNNSMSLGAGYAQSNLVHGADAGRSKDRYQPYFPSGTGASNKGVPVSWKDNGDEGKNKIFVANLAFSVTQHDLQQHLEKVGSVVKCMIFKKPDGSSRGIGVAEYRDAESVERAVTELKDSELLGRRMFVRKHIGEEERQKMDMVSNKAADRPRPPPNPAATIFVSNLDFSVGWQQLRDVFKAAGKVLYVDIQTDRNNQSKGMACIQFSTTMEALNAIALFHGQILYNRSMLVRMDNHSPLKPDPLLVKQIFAGGGAHLAVAQSGGGITALAASLGLSPDLVAVLGGGAPRGGLQLQPQPQPQIPPLLGLGTGLNAANIPALIPANTSSASIITPLLGGTAPVSLLDGTSNPSRPQREITALIPEATGMAPPYRAEPRNQQRPQPDYWFNQAPADMGGGAAGRRVKVKNLNFRTPWQKIKDTFKKVGQVEYVDLMKGMDGRPNGCAFVLFASPSDAQEAVGTFHNSELDGRKLDVRIEHY